uniref:Uncharacterized protein n=1 Tax=Wuhan astro-like virus TaxID=2116423 RepID=A0A2P1GMA6_9VIRU|nr:hypothetical protein [Wuhan astro-like virus]
MWLAIWFVCIFLFGCVFLQLAIQHRLTLWDWTVPFVAYFLGFAVFWDQLSTVTWGVKELQVFQPEPTKTLMVLAIVVLVLVIQYFSALFLAYFLLLEPETELDWDDTLEWNAPVYRGPDEPVAV